MTLLDDKTRADDLATLRLRLGQFGFAGAALGLLAIGFRVPKLLRGEGLSTSLLFHLVGALVPLLLFLVCRHRGLSRRALRTLDWLTTFLTASAYGWMAWVISGPRPSVMVHSVSPQLIALLALNYVVFARAALVPSSARRTLWVTGSCIVALVPVAWRAPFDSFAIAAPGIVGSLLGASMWWTLTTALATFTSDVMYGLRRDVQAAREFGQYQLLEQIGAGGMGVVYRARHRMLRRDTALKVLPPTRSSVQAISRFEREVQLTAKLSHPHTVTIFDYGRTPDGLFYYTMELLDGATLEEIVAATGPMPAGRAARVVRQIAGALAEAHELGLVHRDIKPSNIMLCVRGGEVDVAKVLDFGLVRDQLAAPADRVHQPPIASQLVGTPQYLSPEAIRHAGEVGPASDLYSLGAVAYYLLTGAPPFEAATVVELCSHHLWTDPAPLPADLAIPVDLAALILSCLAKDPLARPASARALADEVERLALPAWSESDARAWWRDQQARLVRPDRGEPIRAIDRRTLDVDLDRRAEDPAGTPAGLRGFIRRLWPADAAEA